MSAPDRETTASGQVATTSRRTVQHLVASACSAALTTAPAIAGPGDDHAVRAFDGGIRAFGSVRVFDDGVRAFDDLSTEQVADPPYFDGPHGVNSS